MKISISAFSGKRPKKSPHLLDITEAQTANCANMERGDVRGFQGLSRTLALSGTTYTSLFQYSANSIDSWVTDTSLHLDHVKSPLVNDTYERLYVTGYTEPRVFANDLFTTTFDASTDYYKLGVPYATLAPTVEGGGSLTRYYTYTYVTSYGEEGPPATPGGGSSVAASPEITTIATAPSGRAITKIRLYRTASSTAGVAEFRYTLEADLFSATASYVVGDYVVYGKALYKCITNHSGAWNAANFKAGDGVLDSGLGTDTLPSEDYETPPTGLTHIQTHPAGFLVGFYGNTVYMSEVGLPHTWQYSESVYESIIGLGVYGETIVVLTNGFPYLLVGSHPDSINKSQISTKLPCVSRRSIVSAEDGVFFATDTGLWRIDYNGATNITKEFYTAEQWSDRYPSTMHCEYHNGKVFCWYDYGTAEGCAVIDLYSDLAFDLDYRGQAGWVSDDGAYYLIVNDEASATGQQCIKKWEGDPTNYTYYTWRSKRILLDHEVTFTCGRIFIDDAFYNEVVALINAANDTTNAVVFASYDPTKKSTWFGGSIGMTSIGTYSLCDNRLSRLQTNSMSAYVLLRIYVDDILRVTKHVSDDKIFRIPGGYRGSRVEIQLEGYIPVRKVEIATSIGALRQEG